MALNVLGTELISCSTKPLTGFFRNGCCDTNGDDEGMHTVCIEATQEFLEYSAAVGNDLSTPIPEYHFAGVKPGDCWCLCLSRWVQAFEAGIAPKIRLKATHISAIEHVPMATLKKFASDI